MSGVDLYVVAGSVPSVVAGDPAEEPQSESAGRSGPVPHSVGHPAPPPRLGDVLAALSGRIDVEESVKPTAAETEAGTDDSTRTRLALLGLFFRR